MHALCSEHVRLSASWIILLIMQVCLYKAHMASPAICSCVYRSKVCAWTGTQLFSSGWLVPGICQATKTWWLAHSGPPWLSVLVSPGLSPTTHNGALTQQTIKHGAACLACSTFVTDKWPDVSDAQLRHIGLVLHCRCRCNLPFAKINLRIWRSWHASRSFNLLCCMLSTRA